MRANSAKWAGGLAIGIGATLLALLLCGRVPTQELGAPDERVAAPSEPRQALEPRSSRVHGGQAPALSPGPAEGTESPPQAQPAALSESGDEREQRRLDETLLVGWGMRDGDIAWLREHFEAAERERERLRAASEAEERPLTREERLRIWQFETQLEREIGSENYDRLLYAAGEYNRVRVRVVAPNSLAEAAGFETGDFIVRFDGVPTFKHGHVVDLLYATENDSSVPIEVLRAGEIFELTLSIGPAPSRPPAGRIFGLSVTRDREAP